MRRMRSRRSSFSMAISAMTPFRRRPCASGWASCRALSASAPAARKASRHSVRVAAVTPYLRLVDSRSAPRSSSRTTLALRLADHRPLPPRPVSASRAGRPPGSLCGPGNRRIGVGHLSLLVSQISVQRNRAAGDLACQSCDTFVSRRFSFSRFDHPDSIENQGRTAASTFNYAWDTIMPFPERRAALPPEVGVEGGQALPFLCNPNAARFRPMPANRGRTRSDGSASPALRASPSRPSSGALPTTGSGRSDCRFANPHALDRTTYQTAL